MYRLISNEVGLAGNFMGQVQGDDRRMKMKVDFS
jgi:hypothetical protein